MSDIEARAHSMAHRAATVADLAPHEIMEFGGWLLDAMARLIVVHDDQLIAMDLRLAANQAFECGVLPAAQQKALGIWVATELDDLRARDRRSSDRTDRRASNRSAVFDAYVATVERAGYHWIMGGGREGYSAAVTRGPCDDFPASLLQAHPSKGATPLIALREAMRQAEPAMAAE